MSMSWLWGGQQPTAPATPQNFNDFMPPGGAAPTILGGGGAPPPAGGGDGGDDNKGKSGQMEAYRFDSAALERAAQAAKELEKNPHAKEILEVNKQQEITKQQEFVQMSKQYELEGKQMDIQRERVKGEEQKKLLNEKARHDKQTAEYTDQLARQRKDDELQRQQEAQARQLQMQSQEQARQLKVQEESTARMEAMKRETLEYEAQKRAEADKARLENEVLAKGRVERENHDLTLEKIRLKAEEFRKTRMESISSIGSLMKSGMETITTDKAKMTMLVGGTVATFCGYFLAKRSVMTTFNYIEAHLAKPSLVKETSRLTPLETFKHPIKTLKTIPWRFSKSEDALKDVILPPEIEARTRDLAIKAKNCRRENRLYTNGLFYGPPGTGKTYFCKKMAHNSGMDYAIMAGSDVQRLGKGSTAALDKLFAWANTSRRGLMLFIDEADSFLSNRSSRDVDNSRVVSEFLTHTGTQSHKFMIILTSNLPEELDDAALSRVQFRVEFPLPDETERFKLFGLYFQKYILDPVSSGKTRIKLSPDTKYSAVMKQIATQTPGMSGRDIAYLALEWQGDAITSEDGILTEGVMMKATTQALESLKVVKQWKELRSKKLQYPPSAALVGAAKQRAESNKDA